MAVRTAGAWLLLAALLLASAAAQGGGGAGGVVVVERLPSLSDMFRVPLYNPRSNTARGRLDGSVRCFEIGAYEVVRDVGLRNASGGVLLTRAWAYGETRETASVPGPTISVRPGERFRVRWTNNLTEPGTGVPLRHFLPVDETLHFARPVDWPLSGVPTVVHLHGGRTEPHSDGHMAAWFTPHDAQRGREYRRATYAYDNQQEAMTLWYHDHAVGLTRLNVYAGLYGFAINEGPPASAAAAGASAPSGAALSRLPEGEFDVPIAIADARFLPDGSIHYPRGAPQRPVFTGAPLIGTFVLANGRVWPYMDVQPARYRFRLLVASNLRRFNVTLRAPAPSGTATFAEPFEPDYEAFHVVASDQGLLDAPLRSAYVALMPSERYEIVVDFAPYAGRTLYLANDMAPSAANYFLRHIVQFRVAEAAAGAGPPSLPLSPALRIAPVDRAVPPGARVRRIVMSAMTESVLAQDGTTIATRVVNAIGCPEHGHSFHHHGTLVDWPRVGTWEIWEVHNALANRHVFHVHLVRFLVLDRVRVSNYGAIVDPETGRFTGEPARAGALPLEPYERAWKDSVPTEPASITRLLMYFDMPGVYMVHCHLLEHEDLEMMSEFVVVDS